MKIAILGSNSFLAQNFIDLLLDNDDNHIIGFSKNSENSLFLKYKKNKNLKNFTFFQLNNIEGDALKEILARLDDFEPEYIVNFISSTDMSNSWINPSEYFEIHFIFLYKLLNLLKDKTYLKLFLQTSSQAVYGFNEGEIDETICPKPSTPYGISKLSADMCFNIMKNAIPYAILRLTNFYGEYQKPNKILAKTIFAIKEGNPLPLHGSGEALLSYMHVRDASYAILQAVKYAKTNTCYLIGPNNPISLKNLIGKIASELGYELNAVSYNVPQREGQNLPQWFNTKKAQKELQWEPIIDFDNGIRSATSWVLEHYKELNEYNKKES
jgi:dTDP-glucose 4,6-dehydratase